ncbi:hypothetical protein C0966_17085 (plasmid) [Bacillus methanolicus]|nr:hypothetical protein [Bacillus methanolicus]
MAIYRLCRMLYLVDPSTLSASEEAGWLHKKRGFMQPLIQLNGPKEKRCVPYRNSPFNGVT